MYSQMRKKAKQKTLKCVLALCMLAQETAKSACVYVLLK